MMEGSQRQQTELRTGDVLNPEVAADEQVRVISERAIKKRHDENEPVPDDSDETSQEELDVSEASASPSKEDLQRVGDTLAAQNSEGMAMAAEKEHPEEFAPPMYFVEEDDRHRVEVDVLTDSKGRVQSVSRVGLGIDFSDFKALRHSREWFEFSIPGYEDVAGYRQRSALYRPEAQVMMIEKMQFRNFLLVFHLKAWSLKGRDGSPAELSFDEGGKLDSESLGMVGKVHPIIVDVVLSSFEKDALLIRQ